MKTRSVAEHSASDRNWWKIPSDQRDQRISSRYDFDQFFPVGIEASHVVAQLKGVPHVMLQVFTIVLYQNVLQNPELFGTQVSLSPEQSTLAPASGHISMC
jgi:hypothetical protein